VDRDLPARLGPEAEVAEVRIPVEHVEIEAQRLPTDGIEGVDERV
jgi:hypothetical protein